MRKWIADKLFVLAVKIDGDVATELSRRLVAADDFAHAMLAMIEREPKKRGRPKGRKDGVGPKPAPKKRGRPAKPATWRTHTWVPGEKPAPKKRGRPLGSKNKPKETMQ